MKIIVLTGSGEVNKRAEVLSVKQKFQSDAIYYFDLSSGNLKDIDLCLTAQSLFSNLEKLVIVENTQEDLDLKRLVKKDNTATLLFLASNPKAASKLLASAKEVNAKVMNFDADKEISAFVYLDALIEGRKTVFEEMQKLLSVYGGMYILAMIYYLLRRNLLPLSPSTFMQKKIKHQKQQLSTQDFENLYRMTLQTDFAIKSGSLPEYVAITTLTQKFVNYLR